jgi:putative NADPH-quinone reductase
MTRALVVYCHPLEESFVAAVRDRVLVGLATGGAEVRFTDLHAAGFDPGFTATDHANHLVAGTDPSLESHAEDLQWCDTLVLVYPTWWSGQPAILKGWIDRVLMNEIAWTLPEGAARIKPLLTNIKKLVVVTTHGSTKFVNALEGESGKRTAFRSMRLMFHKRTRCHWVGLYALDHIPLQKRGRLVSRVRRRVRRVLGSG